MAVRKTWESRFKAGDKVPDFKAELQDGTGITSGDLLGKRTILFFYNHDGSETCTKEACNLRDNFNFLKKKGFQVIGVSEDSARKHKNFMKKYKLPYPLIVDEDNALAKKFDIYGEKKFMGRVFDASHRTTFVINEKGRLDAVIHPVESKRHAEQILERVNS